MPVDYSLTAPTDPIQQQKLLAEMMRQRQISEPQEQLTAANQRAHRFDQLAAIAPMINNDGAVQAAQMAQKGAMASSKPAQMGVQGFMLPDNGQFVESPIFAEEKRATRQLSQDNLEARLESIRQGRILQQTLANQSEEGRNDRASEGRILRQTLAQISLDKSTAAKEDKTKGDLDKGVTKYSQTLEKAAVPEFDSALNIAESALKKYPQGKLPGYGRIVSSVPTALLDNEGQGVRADMQQAANVLLKARSGAAVTDSEMRRFLTEVAMGNGGDEATLRRGWNNVRLSFDAKRKSIAAGASPEVHQEFIGRGGKDFRYDTQAPGSGSDDDALINKYLKK